jgi:hypothetical protein
MQIIPFTERRAYPRFPIRISLSYLDPYSNLTVNTETYNISAIGLCMVTEKELPLDTCLEVCIHMDDNGEKIYRKGKVVWVEKCDSNKYKVGIKLDEQKLKPIPLVLRTINHKENTKNINFL